MLRVNGHAVTQIRHNGAIITDVPQRLASCTIDTNKHVVEYTIEGDDAHYGLMYEEFSEDLKRGIKYIWPDGFECRIIID